MEIYDVLTLDDHKEYVILDTVIHENEKYLYCVEIDKKENPLDEFIIAKVIDENNVLEILEEELLEKLIKLFQEKLENEEQDV